MLRDPLLQDHTFIIEKSVLQTINLALDRNYLMTFEHLKKIMVGGYPENLTKNDLLSLLRNVKYEHGFFYPVDLKNKDKLIEKGIERRKLHLNHHKKATRIASEFIQEFVKYCPFVKSILLSGSLSTGGFRAEDDIDFNIFCNTGTKYITWLIAVILGIKYSLKYRKRNAVITARTGLPVEKLICVNVVWWESQSIPFGRQDLGLGFELVLSKVLYNPNNYYNHILAINRKWLKPIFPQLYQKTHKGFQISSKPSIFSKILNFLTKSNYIKRFLETTARQMAWVIFHFVQWKRRNNPYASNYVKRIAKVKYPYEVFQENVI